MVLVEHIALIVVAIFQARTTIVWLILGRVRHLIQVVRNIEGWTHCLLLLKVRGLLLV